MVGEDKAPKKTSEVPASAANAPAEVPEHGSEPGNKEYTEVETKQNFAKISANNTSDVPASATSTAANAPAESFPCDVFNLTSFLPSCSRYYSE